MSLVATMRCLSFLILVAVIRIADADLLQCTTASPCSGSNTCSDTVSDCELNCKTGGSTPCGGTMDYTCEEGTNLCKITCDSTSTNYASCNGLTVYSSADTEILCTGYEACLSSTFTIIGNDTNNVNVNITCLGRRSCYGITVNLIGTAPNDQVSLSCSAQAFTNYYSCRAIKVNCNFTSAQCKVKCASEDNKSCVSNTLNCYTNGIGTTCDNETPNDYGWTYGITFNPSAAPTQPSTSPTSSPTAPTNAPTLAPSVAPSGAPSYSPTAAPTFAPSSAPSRVPSGSPTAAPSGVPTFSPSGSPSQPPSVAPSNAPSQPPTSAPTNTPSQPPSSAPSVAPTFSPTTGPSSNPTVPPTMAPSVAPSNDPSQPPTSAPTNAPTDVPSAAPSTAPSPQPTISRDLYDTDIVSNYVVHKHVNLSFSFPAAIGKCMQEYPNSETYRKYECDREAENASYTQYSDDDCTERSGGPFPLSRDDNDDEFRCNGNDTFIELKVWQNGPTSVDCKLYSDDYEMMIFVAHGVCTKFDDDDELAQNESLYFQAYCGNTTELSFAKFYYFDGDEQCIYNDIAQQDDELLYADDDDGHECLDVTPNSAANPVRGGWSTGTIHAELLQCYTNPVEADESTIDDNKPNSDVDASTLAGYIILIVAFGFPFIIVAILWMWHLRKKGTDWPVAASMAVFKFVYGVNDIYSDAYWTISLYNEDSDLWRWAALFVFGPHILSVIVCIACLSWWKNKNSYTKKTMSAKVRQYDKFLIFLSLFAGFYASMDLATSHCFHITRLSLPISNTLKSRLYIMKIINMVLLENAPCLYLQLRYLHEQGVLSKLTDLESIDVSNDVLITLVAMAFSMFSVLFGVLAAVERLINGGIECCSCNGTKSITLEIRLINEVAIVDKDEVDTVDGEAEPESKAKENELPAPPLNRYQSKSADHGASARRLPGPLAPIAVQMVSAVSLGTMADLNESRSQSRDEDSDGEEKDHEEKKDPELEDREVEQSTSTVPVQATIKPHHEHTVHLSSVAISDAFEVQFANIDSCYIQYKKNALIINTKMKYLSEAQCKQIRGIVTKEALSKHEQALKDEFTDRLKLKKDAFHVKLTKIDGEETGTMEIKNAMVVLLTIGEYDDTTPNQQRAQQLRGKTLADLEVAQDIINVTEFFGSKLGFDIFPYESVHDLQLEWTQKKIIGVLQQEAERLNRNQIEQPEGSRYDALIVVISSHGIKGHICTSDYRLIEKQAIHRIFSARYPAVREIPRIFIFDGCEGEEQHEEAKKPELDIRSKSGQDEEEKKQNEQDAQSVHDEKEVYVFTEAHIEKAGWTGKQSPPDYKLVKLDASSAGFQSYVDLKDGSLLIYEFTKILTDDFKKHSGQKSEKTIGETIDQIQKQLLDQNGAKQHITPLFNDGTRSLHFVKNPNRTQ